MKKIRVLVENIREELADAEKYAKLAVESKDNDRDLSEMYLDLSEQELHHAAMEHDQVVRIIRDERSKGNEAPKEMLAIWEWEHRRAIEDEAAIRAMLSVQRR